jgi:hypothetical protein
LVERQAELEALDRVLGGPLSEPAVRELVAELLGPEPDRDFVAACHRATGGNPFLLRELLGELARRGVAIAYRRAAEHRG